MQRSTAIYYIGPEYTADGPPNKDPSYGSWACNDADECQGNGNELQVALAQPSPAFVVAADSFEQYISDTWGLKAGETATGQTVIYEKTGQYFDTDN